jgi:uracil-DNA glycosylase
MSKKQKLARLVEKRRTAPYEGYHCLADYSLPGDPSRTRECEYVSPYTKGAHNFEAAVMVMLQDWSSDLTLRNPRNAESSECGHDPKFPTNIRLKKLLKNTFDLELEDTYATNLFPFIKGGLASARIPFKDLQRAAVDFAIPQIEIVKPKIVICLGKNTFNAIRVARDHLPARTMHSAIASPFHIGKSAVWAQAHTGSWGQANRNRSCPGRTFDDWMQMKDDSGIGCLSTAQKVHACPPKPHERTWSAPSST